MLEIFVEAYISDPTIVCKYQVFLNCAIKFTVLYNIISCSCELRPTYIANSDNTALLQKRNIEKH